MYLFYISINFLYFDPVGTFPFPSFGIVTIVAFKPSLINSNTLVILELASVDIFETNHICSGSLYTQ